MAIGKREQAQGGLWIDASSRARRRATPSWGAECGPGLSYEPRPESPENLHLMRSWTSSTRVRRSTGGEK